MKKLLGFHGVSGCHNLGLTSDEVSGCRQAARVCGNVPGCQKFGLTPEFLADLWTLKKKSPHIPSTLHSTAINCSKLTEILSDTLIDY
jgi:hypothetical protein